MRAFIITILFFSVYVSLAQTLNQNIEQAYTRLEQDEQLRYGIASFTVLNAETGETIFCKNDNIGLVPASTLKTITAATALALLGEKFTWDTVLGYSGDLSATGVLTGDLILVGGGDPALGSTRYDETSKGVLLEKWITAVRQAGIKEIHGRVVIDDRLFGTQTLPNGWIWQDIGNYFGAGASAISWGDNQFDVVFQPTKVGEPTILLNSEAQPSYLKIINEVKTGELGSGDQVYAYSAPYSHEIYLRGTYGLDLKKTIFISAPDPAFELAFRFQEALKNVGITIDQLPTTARRLALDNILLRRMNTILSVHTSPTLKKIVNVFNQKSINLYGEHLIKTLAWKQGKAITTEEGIIVIKNFWANKLKIDINALNMVDGSGLSPVNRVTTQTIAKILSVSKKEAWFDTFYESIPINNNMKMKSGSMNSVLAYAGYQTTLSGIPVVFSFIINNYHGNASNMRQKVFSMLDCVLS